MRSSNAAMAVVAALAAALAAASGSEVCPECLHTVSGVDSQTQFGRGNLRLVSRDDSGDLAERVVVDFDGDVVVPDGMLAVRGGVQVATQTYDARFDTAEAGSVVAVPCPALVVLPPTPAIGTQFTVLAPDASPSCTLRVVPDDPELLVNGVSTLASPHVYLGVARPGRLEMVFVNDVVGWRSRSIDPLVPIGRHCGDLVSVGLSDDAYYYIDPTGDEVIRTFCKMTEGGWTLIESLDIQFNRFYNGPGRSFLVDDAHHGADAKDHLGSFRMSRPNMLAIQALTTTVRATCVMITHGDGNYLEFEHSQVDLLNYVQEASGVCVDVKAACFTYHPPTSNVPQYDCCDEGAACQVPLIQDAADTHLHVKLQDNWDSCPDSPRVNPAGRGGDYFGHYHRTSQQHWPCGGPDKTTTEYWMY